MGTDIFGWVECKWEWQEDGEPWNAAINVGLLVDRSYDAFGCLFGVRNYAGFRPIAADRGVPADASAEFKASVTRFPKEVRSSSWITWPEIKAIDWEEDAEEPDERLHTYVRNEQGELVLKGKSLTVFGLKGSMKPTPQALAAAATPEDVREWEDEEGKIIRAEVLKRKDVFAWGKHLFQVMDSLAERFGEERVRLVVWFDW
ncbi:MAG TPA: hypothetical protein VKT82_09400 [Ktedonobacterales bacterium]|nr:hypothetical protein [Ktedonobacterales bacterium]